MKHFSLRWKAPTCNLTVHSNMQIAMLTRLLFRYISAQKVTMYWRVANNHWFNFNKKQCSFSDVFVKREKETKKITCKKFEVAYVV